MNKLKLIFTIKTIVLGLSLSVIIPSSVSGAEKQKTLKLSMDEATWIVLENNLKLKLEQLKPVQYRLLEAAAEFDPRLSATISHDNGQSSSGVTAGSVRLSKPSATGTTLEMAWSLVQDARQRGNTSVGSSLRMTKALRKGGDKEANLVRLNQARIASAANEYEVRGVAISLAGQARRAFLNGLLAQMRIEILSESLVLANRQKTDAENFIRLGRLPGVERAASHAELAKREEDLLAAKGELEKALLTLRGLLSLPNDKNWNTSIELIPPQASREKLPALDKEIKKAVQKRPEVSLAELQLKTQSLEIVAANDGVLPKLDVFLELGRQGLGGTVFNSARNFIPIGNDVQLGVNYEASLGKKAEKARRDSALMMLGKEKISIDNLKYLIEEEIRTAFVDLKVAMERLPASLATLKLQETQAKAEQDKFRLGKTTSLQVAQAQRDLLSAQVARAESQIRIDQAWLRLEEATGVLLEKYGIKVGQKD